jgi:hypothetical protein
MPLSEQEQRLLEEMERSLYHNDADFVATVTPRRGKPNYTILVVGILVGVLGIATLVAGVVLRQPIVGVLGFIIMFAGVLIAAAPPRRGVSTGRLPEPPRSNTSSSRTSGSGSFMQNMNDRWEKRQDNRDQ